jgi:hypothetical protein
VSGETENRSSKASDGGGPEPGSRGSSSPLQARAAFLENWDWVAVIGVNRRACARGGAQHGINSETGGACETEWQRLRHEALTLGDTFDSLRRFHRSAPFLFFNGNTFATIARELCFVLFSDMAPGRRREIASAAAHYVAGVLDREAMAEILECLAGGASHKPGDPVKSLRGSLHGHVVRLLPDGRVVWKPTGGAVELTALPESLLPDGTG